METMIFIIFNTVSMGISCEKATYFVFLFVYIRPPTQGRGFFPRASVF